MRRLLIVAVLMAALLAPAATEAARKLPAEEIGVADGPVVSDGSMAAFQDPSGTVHVYEPGRWRRFAPPRRKCAAPARLSAIGSGLLVFDVSCDDWKLVGAVVRIATGKVRRTRTLPDEGDHGGDRFTAIGRRWARIDYSGYHWHTHRFVDWRTGLIKRDRIRRGGSLVYPDLDRDELFGPICRPLQRGSNPYDDPYDSGPPWLDHEQRGGYAITQWMEHDSTDPWAWTLHRCGSDRPLRGFPWKPALGRGVVSWARRERPGIALRLHDRRRFRLRRGVGPVAVADRRVFLTRSIGEWRSRVFTTLIPR